MYMLLMWKKVKRNGNSCSRINRCKNKNTETTNILKTEFLPFYLELESMPVTSS